MDKELIDKVNSYLDSLDKKRREEARRKAKELEAKRFKLGFVLGSSYIVDTNKKPTGSIVNFISTEKRTLCYFISAHRYDAQEKIRVHITPWKVDLNYNGVDDFIEKDLEITPIFYRTDVADDIRVKECKPIRKENFFFNVPFSQYEYDNNYDGIKEIINKTIKETFQEYGVFTSSPIEDISPKFYFSYLSSANNRIDREIQELKVNENKTLHDFISILCLRRDNSHLRLRSNLFPSDKCKEIIESKIKELTEYVDSCDLKSIVDSYHVYIDSEAHNKIGGDDSLEVFLKTQKDERIDSYIETLLPLYSVLLFQGHGYSEAYSLCPTEDWIKFKEKAKVLEKQNKESFFKKYNRNDHIGYLLNKYLENTCKEYYAPKIESFYNLYKIAELQGKLLKKYDLNRPLFMYTNLHGEEEIANLIRKYNLHEL